MSYAADLLGRRGGEGVWHHQAVGDPCKEVQQRYERCLFANSEKGSDNAMTSASIGSSIAAGAAAIPTTASLAVLVDLGNHAAGMATGAAPPQPTAAADSLKPMFHVMPVSGWGSDPNGPIFYKGRYHLFYQARPGTCQWYWGMCWDHVVSYDLAHWERLPMALVPTPGGIDADGCFSGSIQVEPQSGIPVCFYTAARLRTNREVALPHPPPSHDMGLKHIETQCCAICDPGMSVCDAAWGEEAACGHDELLVKWRKVPMPLMELPHTGQLTAWRDPWFVEQGDGRGREWTMLIGSGLKDGGGTALVYRTQDITRGWRFVGHLCSWPDPGTGICWECPFLVQLQPLPLCAHVLPTTDLAALMEAEGDGEGEDVVEQTAEEAKMIAGGGYDRSKELDDANGGYDTYGDYQRDDNEGRRVGSVASAEGVEAVAGPMPGPRLLVSSSSASALTADSGRVLAVGLVDTLLHVVTSAAGPAVTSGGAGGNAFADGLGPASLLPSIGTLAPRAASADGNGGGGIDISITAAAAAPSGDGAAGAADVSTVTITVTRAAGHTGETEGVSGAAAVVATAASTAAAAAAVAGVNGVGSITTATATVQDGGEGAKSASAVIQFTVAPMTAASSLDAVVPAAAVPRRSVSSLDAARTTQPPQPSSVPAAVPAATADEGIAAAAPGQAPIVRSCCLTSSTLTASATVPAAAAADRAVLQDLHTMVTQVMEARRARARADAEAAAAAAAAAEEDASLRGDSGGAVGSETTSGGKLSYSPGVMGHSAVPEPDTEVEPLPAPVTMRYHKAQPLLPAGVPYSAAVVAASCLPLHGDVDSASGHAHAPSLLPDRRWFFCCAPDACTYSIIYWIGEYDSTTAKYDMKGAEAGGRPRKLDLGNVLYAPTCFKDPQGRHILWGYMKELRNVPAPPCLCNKYSYAGCVSLPRALYLRGDKLFQLPLPELTALRSDVAVHFSRVSLTHGSPWRLMGLRGLHLDLEMAISPGTAHRTVVLLRSWRPRGRGAAALVYDWTSRRLYVVFEAMHPSRQALWCGEHPPAGASTASAMTPPTPMAMQPPHEPWREGAKSSSSPPSAEAAVPGGGGGRGGNTSISTSTTTNSNSKGGNDGSSSDEAATLGGATYGWPSVETGLLPAEMAPDVSSSEDVGSSSGGDGCFVGDSAGGATTMSLLPRRSGSSSSSGHLQAEAAAGVGGVGPSRPDGGLASARIAAAAAAAGGVGGGSEGGGNADGPELDELDEEENEHFDVIRDPDFIPDPDMNPLVEDWIRMKRDEAGGDLDLPPGSPLRLRVFLDASCLEVFTGSGQVLTTRVYRGHAPHVKQPDHHRQPPDQQQHADPGIEVWSVGGSCSLDDLHAYEMDTAWLREGDAPRQDT
ncbi:hypothetical protein VOLCADRAFT_88180 [Volvox carteri f. nagariensis]|uniref:Glycosyl hydrolase family 32 N-terminal domain-containing protein n=1 Tax=Volvox carteri f. nagariensis TaxID=3068 RepID=D8TNH5_VOLCA|nr:uncharacterized protein VOLCADRAFT_88180 [Volvox carteri f. nagariensis]EFJ50995.1 hypothetical protein VOLCADRAFT_88180 [Volvox carteri f. nagariensis]|eukprot:XP_002948007.1 hypothetical protein VOLCADRAFT_88180 [Volvox carteri f. nagariensis]